MTILATFTELLDDNFGQDVATPLEVLTATCVSFVLNMLIGAVYKNTYRGTRYSQDYVHTLVIIGTVTTILIMVVSGSMEIAFGMFAAFSLIRFRRNLGQSRDLAFVFFAMATGMVVGARMYPEALVSTAVITAVVYVLTKSGAFAPNSASHQLRVRVNNDIDWDAAFGPVFEKYLDAVELISVETVQAAMMTELRYGMQLKPDKKTSDFMEQMQIASGNNRILLTSTKRELDS
ncbi:MAG: DUF4956 domain-containing protein [Verrucomicrobia bacterium]|nr:DUF4956 domain-containing protein [Verrucomicrobiota bacterium]MDA1006220.1 DUF4956 domain-containing protein [Verrucomicrobiota bacterium]